MDLIADGWPQETLWFSQALMAELFHKDVRTINEHLQNIFAEGELDSGSTIRKFRIVRQEGQRQVARQIDHYSLDAILAVGYRVKSLQGTQFRTWATERLREYLVKGFTMDDERQPNMGLTSWKSDVVRKGAISKADADAKAKVAYEAFAERRRALLEAEGERAQHKALENAAKDLPTTGVRDDDTRG